MKKLFTILFSILYFIIFLSFSKSLAAEAILIPIHVHILESDEEGFKTKTTLDSVKKDLDRANTIWSESNIIWNIKEISFIKYKPINHLIRVKKIKNDCLSTHACTGKASKSKRDKLRKFYNETVRYSETNKKNTFNVYYIPSSIVNVCGITFMPKSVKKNYVIIGQKKNPTPGFRCSTSRTLAHELGHLLSLKHVGGTENLMSTGGVNGKELNNTQKNKAYNFYKSKINFK